MISKILLYFEVGCFAWVLTNLKCECFSCFEIKQKLQISKYSKILPIFYTYMWDMAFEGFDFNFCNTNFLGTIMVPILSLNSSNSFQFLNKNISTKRTNVTLQPNVVPQMVPKKSFSKIVNSELSSDVSAMCIVILYQKLHTCQYSWFFDIPLNLQKYHFFV